VGLLVPSSNTTMETEVPEVLRRVAARTRDRFTFHSNRMRMKTVSAEELAAMNADADRAAVELADASVDVMAYACLVAIMSQGRGVHRDIEKRLAKTAADAGAPVDVVSSAGALVAGLQHLGARKVSIVTPYMKPLTALVADYIEAEGVECRTPSAWRWTTTSPSAAWTRPGCRRSRVGSTPAGRTRWCSAPACRCRPCRPSPPRRRPSTCPSSPPPPPPPGSY